MAPAHQGLDTRQAHQKRTEQGSTTSSTMPQATASRITGSAKKYDEAPPEQPDSTSFAKKPVFTRGPSVMDYTAIISAGPTPAGEIPNPFVLNIVKGESRQRESHLPDIDIV